MRTILIGTLEKGQKTTRVGLIMGKERVKQLRWEILSPRVEVVVRSGEIAIALLVMVINSKIETSSYKHKFKIKCRKRRISCLLQSSLRK